MDGEALLRAIIDGPADDLRRLVYADWLEEQGEANRAEFIRVQLELALYEDKLGGGGLNWNRLNQRQAELWSSIFREFDVGIVPGSALLLYDDQPSLLIRGDRLTVRAYPRRGFVALIHLPLAAWMEHGPWLVQVQPLEKVTLSDKKAEGYPVSADQKVLWRWFNGSRADGPDSDDLDELPGTLWEMYTNFVDDWNHPTEQAANDVLSHVCLAWARQQAFGIQSAGGILLSTPAQ